MKKQLWILTEERPKKEVIETILQLYLKDKKISAFIDNIRIIPVIEKKKFTFVYEITGIKSPKLPKILLKIVSGNSSFVDYLVFETSKEPTPKDKPIYVIEETKTDDKESRNTGIYQRATKFVYADFYYPNVRKIMLYNLQVEQKEKATLTNIFGTKLLKTLGVEIIGNTGINDKKFDAFKTIDEIITLKNKMPETKNGTSIKLRKYKNKITISAKLEKGGRLASDPSIGTTTIISACLRKLGWDKDIVITQHNLPDQKSVGKTNKFIQIANQINIKLSGLKIPVAMLNDDYWHYDTNGEKIGTILLDIVVEEFSNGFTIYHNHAGCERGYFLTEEGEKLAVVKYHNRQAYKKGNKKEIIALPDLVLLDPDKKEIINIEGEMYQNADAGIKQLSTFKYFEKLYIKAYYPKHKIIRTVVLYGGKDKKKPIGKISFVLTLDGYILVSITAPELFKKSFKNIFSYWK